jgi:hypothetical protein
MPEYDLGAFKAHLEFLSRDCAKLQSGFEELDRNLRALDRRVEKDEAMVGTIRAINDRVDALHEAAKKVQGRKEDRDAYLRKARIVLALVVGAVFWLKTFLEQPLLWTVMDFIRLLVGRSAGS